MAVGLASAGSRYSHLRPLLTANIFMIMGLLSACASAESDGPDGPDAAIQQPADAEPILDAMVDDSGTHNIKPDAHTQAAIESYLTSQHYREAPWVAETANARPRSTPVSPHDRVRVWFNSVLVDSQKAGNGTDLSAPPHVTDSMVVKEFFDANEQLLGHAVMLKLAGNRDAWVYYCMDTSGRCGNSSTPPVYATGSSNSCAGCHAGMVFTRAP